MQSLQQLLEFPSSALLAVSFLLIAVFLYRYAGNYSVVRMLGSTRTACVLLAVGAAILAVEGTWSLPLHSTPLFLVYALLLLLSLAVTLLNGISRGAKLGFVLNHLGVFLIIWAALFGSPDVSRSKMVVEQGQSVNVAYISNGMLVPLPFEVSLQEFSIDYYDDGRSPRQFTSRLVVGGEPMEVAVNSPVTYQGYTIYQDSYDRQYGRYTVLQLVRDPWLPIIYLGMAMLAVGSVLLLFGRWRLRIVLPITLVLTMLFTALTVAKINFGTLMPALRSWWFVPHLFIYMVAYSLMALALVLWLVASIRHKDSLRELSNNIVRSSSALLIIGMLTGSVWARQAWGDYWAWDPKENWAAVTWFVTLLHLHLQNRRGWKAIVVLALAFMALQITWYGVNYLPSAAQSLHTYNS